MELEKDIIEQVQTQDQTETVDETVSTDDQKKEQPKEWIAPASKEEFDNLVNSAVRSSVDKAKTELLKQLGVVGVKQFKELQAKVESDKANIENITNERDQYANSVKELEAKYQKISQESLLKELNVDEQYREDLLELANKKVNETNPLDKVLREMVEGKYKYTTAQPTKIKMGTEKSHISEKELAEAEMKRLRKL